MFNFLERVYKLRKSNKQQENNDLQITAKMDSISEEKNIFPFTNFQKLEDQVRRKCNHIVQGICF